MRVGYHEDDDDDDGVVAAVPSSAVEFVTATAVVTPVTVVAKRRLPMRDRQRSVADGHNKDDTGVADAGVVATIIDDGGGGGGAKEYTTGARVVLLYKNNKSRFGRKARMVIISNPLLRWSNEQGVLVYVWWVYILV